MTTTAAAAADTKDPATAVAPSATTSMEALMEPIFYRLTDGLPLKELEQIIGEGKDAEAALKQDIVLLKKAMADKLTPEETTVVDGMLATEYAPPDKYFTLSAHLGRLPSQLALPLAPNSTLPVRPNKIKKTTPKAANSPVPSSLGSLPQQLLKLQSYPAYTKKHDNTAVLLATWKRISSPKIAAVFRRPVNPKEAPGYVERIHFPSDLQLIRKMITAKQIASVKDLHISAGALIAHNCVKFNGRYSDYAIVAQEFEQHVDSIILETVLQGGAVAVKPAATVSSTAKKS